MAETPECGRRAERRREAAAVADTRGTRLTSILLERDATLFETLLQYVETYPHLVFFTVLILCGIGLPFPEEIILVAAGYTSYLGKAGVLDLFGVCALAILCGDLLPFTLGRIFGPKLLRLRLVRSWISQRRLAHFDNWFRRHGRLTIFVARFLTGIRVPAFFAAGSMRMSFLRFLLMDSLGVLISAPLFIGLGHAFGGKIDVVLRWVRTTERVVLWTIVAGVVVAFGLYLWYRRRRSRRLLGREVQETFVGPPTLEQARGDADFASGPAAADSDPGAHDHRGVEAAQAPEPPETPADADSATEPEAEPQDASTTLEPPSGHR